MHADDRKAFDATLAELFGAIDKPLGEATREAFWKGLAKMTLLEFSRVRDLLLDEFSQGEAPRKFGVPDIWAAKKRLRAQAPPPDDAPRWTGDDWDVRANYRLMSVIMRAVMAKQAFSEPEIHTLVAFKNRWAELMRESGEVSLAEQNECWNACMQQAREQFEQRRAA